MKIGGFISTSLIDFPKKVSCVIFLSGCNFDCPYCYNPELAKGGYIGSNFLSEDLIFDFLESHKGFLDGVVICGGEPTVHSDLVSFCDRIRLIGYPIKLDTNGSRPESIRKLLDKGLIDYIAMDVKTSLQKYRKLTNVKNIQDKILASIRIIMESKVDYEFRTTCAKSIVAATDIDNILRMINGADRYILQCCRETKSLDPMFFHDHDNFYTSKDMECFQLKALANVKACWIR